MSVKKRILVTGGFGFVGSHLIECLLENEENFVYVVDNLSTNPIPLSKLLQELGKHPNLYYEICSVEEFLDRNSNNGFADEIYHLASVVGPAGVLSHAGQIVKSIISDTYSIMDLAIRDGARLLDVSTSEVYGGGKEGYCSESLPKIIPAKITVRLEYAIGKLASEVAMINMTKVTDLNARIIRPFNIAGPRQSGQGGFVLPRFIAQALKEQPITVFGDGGQVRAFTHVRDIVSGLVEAMEHGQSGEVYNLGNPDNRMTILELADLVLEVTGSASPKIFVDPKTIYGPLYEEANDKFPDATKAMNHLDWRPKFSKEEIVQDTFEYMKSLDKGLLDILAGKRVSEGRRYYSAAAEWIGRDHAPSSMDADT